VERAVLIRWHSWWRWHDCNTHGSELGSFYKQNGGRELQSFAVKEVGRGGTRRSWRVGNRARRRRAWGGGPVQRFGACRLGVHRRREGPETGSSPTTHSCQVADMPLNVGAPGENRSAENQSRSAWAPRRRLATRCAERARRRESITVFPGQHCFQKRKTPKICIGQQKL
jgi:hypothetical protein